MKVASPSVPYRMPSKKLSSGSINSNEPVTLSVSARSLSGQATSFEVTSAKPSVDDLAVQIIENYWKDSDLSHLSGKCFADGLRINGHLGLLVNVIVDHQVLPFDTPLQNHPEYSFILFPLAKCSESIEYLSGEASGALYSETPSLLKESPYFVLQAAKGNVKTFKYASDQLKQDIPFIKKLISKARRNCENDSPLYYLSENLRENYELAHEELKKSGLSLRFVAKNLQADRDLVEVAVTQNGLALAYASQNLQGDREVVAAAIKQDGMALQYASNQLRNDLSLAREAVKKSANAYRFVSEKLRDDRDLLRQAIAYDANLLRYASSLLKVDREIVHEAISKNGLALQYATDELRADYDLVLEAVSQNPWALRYAAESLKADRSLVLAAVKRSGAVLSFAAESLRQDPELLNRAYGKKARRHKTNSLVQA